MRVFFSHTCVGENYPPGNSPFFIENTSSTHWFSIVMLVMMIYQDCNCFRKSTLSVFAINSRVSWFVTARVVVAICHMMFFSKKLSTVCGDPFELDDDNQLKVLFFPGNSL